MAELIPNEPEISRVQRRQFAGQVLAAVGIGRMQRRLHLAHAWLPLRQTPYRWDCHARYTGKDTHHNNVDAYFSYEITTIGEASPTEHYRVALLSKHIDEGVMDRQRYLLQLDGEQTTYTQATELYDPFSNAYVDTTRTFHALFDDVPERPQRQPITTFAYEAFVQTYALIASGNLKRRE